MERMSKVDGQRLSSQGGAIEKRHSEASPVIDENEEWAKVWACIWLYSYPH